MLRVRAIPLKLDLHQALDPHGLERLVQLLEGAHVGAGGDDRRLLRLLHALGLRVHLALEVGLRAGLLLGADPDRARLHPRHQGPQDLAGGLAQLERRGHEEGRAAAGVEGSSLP